MSPVWVVSAVLAWGVIALLVAVILSLLRQTGELRQRLDELDGGLAFDAPEWDAAEGDPVPTVTVPLLPGSASHDGGALLELGGRRSRGLLLVFHAPGCAGCAGVEEALDGIGTGRSRDSGVDVISVLALAPDAAAAHLRRRPLPAAPSISIDALPRELRRPTTPSALGISADGVVATIGRPDGQDALAALVDATATAGDPVA